jgi:hypothetical protein
MANQFLNAQEYANVMLLLLKNQLVFGRLVDGQFKNEVSDENGLTVSVKRPPRFIDKKDGTANLAAQDVVTGSSPVAVDQYSKVHISIGDIEYVTSFNALMQNATMKSAASTLAHSIDGFIAGQTKRFHSWVAGGNVSVNAVIAGNATDPTQLIKSPQQAMGAHTRLMAQGVPNSDLSGVVTFTDGQGIRGSLLSDFTPDMNADALQRVRIPIISEVDWYASQQLPILTGGTRPQGDGSSTGGQVNGANQNVNYADVKGVAGSTSYMQQTLAVDGLGAGVTIKQGEVFTIAGVYAWDWRAQQATEFLQQYTVLADATADGTGAIAALSISPAIIVPQTGGTQAIKDTNSAFGTVDSIPADNAYIQFAGAASAKMTIKPVFHKRAISLVSTRLHTPFTGVASFAVDPDTGIAVRYWRGSDISTGAHIHRWDCMYGAAVLDPFLGTRIAGKVAD